MSKSPSPQNTSPYGWWIATYVIRAQWDDAPEPEPGTRCLAWENTIILKAKTREAAYKKAIKLGKSEVKGRSFWEDDNEERTAHWEFEGLISLLPIYEPLEDGSEIMWNEYKNKTVKTIRSWVKQKHELSVFQDDEQ